MIALPVGFLECVANIDGDIDADFIDESQWTHRHPPLHKRLVDFVRVHAAFEKFSGVKQVRKQNAVDEKTWTIVHEHGQLPDLPREGQRSLAGIV